MNKEDIIERIAEEVEDVNYNINEDINHDPEEINGVVTGCCEYLIQNISDIINEIPDKES